MFIKFVDIEWLFLCNSYSCVLFESLSHVINQESHVYSWNLGKIYRVHFWKFWNLPRFTRKISRFQKSAPGKFIPNFPLKHVVTSTSLFKHFFVCYYHQFGSLLHRFVWTVQGQYPTFSFNKNHQVYTNLTPYWVKFW